MNVFEEYGDPEPDAQEDVPLYWGDGEDRKVIGTATLGEDGMISMKLDSDIPQAKRLIDGFAVHSSYSIRPDSSADDHEHLPVQHRDGKPRWCNECGLTADRKEPQSSIFKKEQ